MNPAGPAPAVPIFALVVAGVDPVGRSKWINFRPWVARITGFSTQFGVEREFVRPLTDWSQARGHGKSVRGLSYTFVLRVGWIVEAYYLQDPHDEAPSRFFARVQPAGLQPIEIQELVECVASMLQS